MTVYSRKDFARELDVSRETLVAFDAWHELLKKWNQTINLVSPAAMQGFWRRHALDSWQATRFLPQGATRAIDLGSGAGFPGVALGIAMRERGSGDVLLVESAGKKATFLRTVARELDLPVRVAAERAEALQEPEFDVVSARAFAPLPRLLSHAERFWGQGTMGVFLKGEGVEAEIAEARRTYAFDVDSHASLTSDRGKVLVVRGLERLEKAHA